MCIRDSLLDNGKELKVKTYYPYISDLSYLALPYTDDELQILWDNMPTLGRSYHVPLQTMKELDLSVINLGGYGFDAHKWTERLERCLLYTSSCRFEDSPANTAPHLQFGVGGVDDGINSHFCYVLTDYDKRHDTSPLPTIYSISFPLNCTA